MLADHRLNMTGENTVVISDDYNGLPPSKEDVRQDIWWYLYSSKPMKKQYFH